MSSFGERLLTLLFPHKCFLCGKVLAGTGWLCEECEPPVTGDELCPGCGKPYEECLCGEYAPVFTGVCVPFYYSDGVRRGIHAYKYDGRSYYAVFLSGRMAKAFSAAFPEVRPDVVTWVPLGRKKLRQRGYCPTELLARGIARRLELPFSGEYLLHTGKGGAQMAIKSPQEREENAKRSFAALGKTRLDGKTVLLVDDVLTTGATARRCAVLLRKLGVRQVYVAVAATARKKNHSKRKSM